GPHPPRVPAPPSNRGAGATFFRARSGSRPTRPGLRRGYLARSIRRSGCRCRRGRARRGGMLPARVHGPDTIEGFLDNRTASNVPPSQIPPVSLMALKTVLARLRLVVLPL